MKIRNLLLKLILLPKQFPQMPEKPKTGQWYRVYLPGCTDSVGNPTYASVKLGTKNKLVVFFEGGGSFLDEYTAARPIDLDADGPEAFYVNKTEPFSDWATAQGIGSSDERNPFRDWNMVTINYSTGDFHVGDGEFSYTNLKGKKAILHHHGYQNFLASMKAALPYVGSPDTLVIAGASAGAFATSALAGEVREMFPACQNVSCLVDGALLLKDWAPILQLWKVPEHIASRVTTPNYALDMMITLHQKHPDIHILFVSSPRDGELAKYQTYLDGGALEYTKESGEKFYEDLQTHLRRLKEAIPQSHVYLYDLPYPNLDAALNLTQHTIVQSPHFYDEGDSAAQWLMDCVTGVARDHLL